jgi:hypothetical protein
VPLKSVSSVPVREQTQHHALRGDAVEGQHVGIAADDDAPGGIDQHLPKFGIFRGHRCQAVDVALEQAVAVERMVRESGGREALDQAGALSRPVQRG